MHSCMYMYACMKSPKCSFAKPPGASQSPLSAVMYYKWDLMRALTNQHVGNFLGHNVSNVNTGNIRIYRGQQRITLFGINF